jgi:hypothetical protein
MNADKEEYITTLIEPDEYVRHLNQVASLSSMNIVFLKRKFISKSGWELVKFPVSDCARIFYKDERPLAIIVSGLLLTTLIVGIFYLLFVSWDNLEPSTRIPIGALGVAGFYGFRWVFGSRRHKFIFELKDKTRLVWKSRSGDYVYKKVCAQKIIDFAKSSGLWRPYGSSV